MPPMEPVSSRLKKQIGPDGKPQLLFVLLEEHRTIFNLRMLRIEPGGFHGLSQICLEVNDLEIDSTDPSSPLKGNGEPFTVHVVHLDAAGRIPFLLEANLPCEPARLPCQAFTLHLKILLIVRVKNKDLGRQPPVGEVIGKNGLVVLPVPVFFDVKVSMLRFTN